jgi:hypothetical protein
MLRHLNPLFRPSNQCEICRRQGGGQHFRLLPLRPTAPLTLLVLRAHHYLVERVKIPATRSSFVQVAFLPVSERGLTHTQSRPSEAGEVSSTMLSDATSALSPTAVPPSSFLPFNPRALPTSSERNIQSSLVKGPVVSTFVSAPDNQDDLRDPVGETVIKRPLVRADPSVELRRRSFARSGTENNADILAIQAKDSQSRPLEAIVASPSALPRRKTGTVSDRLASAVQTASLAQSTVDRTGNSAPEVSQDRTVQFPDSGRSPADAPHMEVAALETPPAIAQASIRFSEAGNDGMALSTVTRVPAGHPADALHHSTGRLRDHIQEDDIVFSYSTTLSYPLLLLETIPTTRLPAWDEEEARDSEDAHVSRSAESSDLATSAPSNASSGTIRGPVTSSFNNVTVPDPVNHFDSGDVLFGRGIAATDMHHHSSMTYGDAQGTRDGTQANWENDTKDASTITSFAPQYGQSETYETSL